MAQATQARCRNRVSCDKAISGELIDIAQNNGRCPDCGQALQADMGNTGSATDNARRKRLRLLAIGGIVLSLGIAGLVVWALRGNGTESLPNADNMDLRELKENNPMSEPEPEPEPDAVAPPDEAEPAPPPPPAIPQTKPEPVAAPPVVEPKPAGPSLETQQHVKQGMVFVSLAKQNPKNRSENIRNALVEFDAAVKQEETEGRCFATAYMNRGIAYWQDKKLNLAEKDLLRASECDAKNPVIFYNLTAYYSAVNKSDLALEPLNQALELGFKDCDILRNDSDLKNLRKQADFRRILEQHQLFCLR